MNLLEVVSEGKSSDPSSLILSGVQKIGKSTLTGHLTTEFAPGDSFVMFFDKREYERKGLKYVGRCVEANPAKGLTAYDAFENLMTHLETHNKRIGFLIIDNYTDFDKFVWDAATLEWYNNPACSKKFNIRRESGEGLPPRYLPGEKGFQTIQSLDYGAGHTAYRKTFERIYRRLTNFADHLILWAHPKFGIEPNELGQDVSRSSIEASVKKTNNWVISQTSGYGQLTRRDLKVKVSFQPDVQDFQLGCSFEHLSNQVIVLSTSKVIEGPNGSKVEVVDEVFWERIYPNYRKISE